MDRRRFLLTSVAGVLAGPLTAEAQSAGKSYRIAFLGSTSPSGYASQMEAFRGGLRDFGYVEGQNFVIEFRWAEGSYERLPELAAELVRSKPDVLVTHGSAGALAAKRATDTIPIVMGVVDEAVEIGAVKGVARPGRNVTGSSFFVPELNAKRLEILKEALPRLSRVGVLLKRGNAVNAAVPQDRQGPRPRDPAVAAGAGGPGHRVVDRRRFVLTLLAAALPAPVDAGAQPGKMSRIGYLGYGVPGSDPSESRDCVHGLRELGYVENQNVVVEYRYAENKPDRLPRLIGELIDLRIDIILAQGTAVTAVARSSATTTPVVTVSGDPVGSGFQSLARPGGNITGLSFALGENFSGKWLQLVKETLPLIEPAARSPRGIPILC